MRRTLRLILPALFCASLTTQNATAQDVLVVDAAGGPTAQYTDLPEAVLAAAPGDILDVFPGDYTGITTAKGIHILGRPGGVTMTRDRNTFEATFGLIDLPRGERFTLRNITLNENGIFSNIVRRCEGFVVMENVVSSWTIDRCANVQMTNCETLALETEDGVEIFGSNVAMDRCTIGISQPLSELAALRVSYSKVTLSQCEVRGNSNFVSRSAPAITSTGSQFVLTGTGPGAIIAAAPGFQTIPTPAIEGTGTAIIDPRLPIVSVHGAIAVDARMQVTQGSVPNLSVVGAAVNGTVQFELLGVSGEPFMIAVGLAAPPRPVRGFIGEFWLDFPRMDAFGTFPANGQFSGTAQVPNDPALAGIHISRQAISSSANGPLSFSNPATYTIRP